MVFTVVFADVLDVVFTAVVLTDEAVDTGAVVTVETAVSYTHLTLPTT